MDEKMVSIDVTLRDDIAQKLAALCAGAGETPEEKIASILEEMLEEGERPAVPGAREGEG